MVSAVTSTVTLCLSGTLCSARPHVTAFGGGSLPGGVTSTFHEAPFMQHGVSQHSGTPYINMGSAVITILTLCLSGKNAVQVPVKPQGPSWYLAAEPPRPHVGASGRRSGSGTEDGVGFGWCGFELVRIDFHHGMQ